MPVFKLSGPARADFSVTRFTLHLNADLKYNPLKRSFALLELIPQSTEMGDPTLKSSISSSLLIVALALGCVACGKEDRAPSPGDTGTQPEDSAVVQDSSGGDVADTTTPPQDVTVPEEDTNGPAQDTATPIEDTATPIEDTATPIEDTAPPIEDTVTPIEDTATPIEDTAPPEGDVATPEPKYTSITLQVDMGCSQLDNFTEVFVAGPWNDWCNSCDIMSDPDGDKIYTITLENQLVGSTLEYAYGVDGGMSQEDLLDDIFLGGPCAPSTDFVNYANRTLVVEPDAVATDTYGSCDPCFSVDGTFVGVLLQVYMGPGYKGPVSIIANWYKELGLNPFELPAMSLAKFKPLALDGIYQGQVKMLDGYVLRYRFVKGNGPNGEVEKVPAACGEGVGDHISRVYAWGDDPKKLEVVPFGACNNSGSAIDNDVVTAPIVINEVQYSMLKDVNGDGQFEFDSTEDEFIEFVNTSDAPVDMSGYTIQDTESLKAGVFNHVVPKGTVIEAGQALVVFGGGNPTGTFGGATVQTATSGSLSLDDFGDIITLADAKGVTVAQFDIEQLLNAPLVAYTRDPDLTGPFVTHVNELSNSPGRANDGKPFGLELAEGECYNNDFVASNLKQGITGCDDALTVLQASFGQDFGCKASLSVVGKSWNAKLADICECMCPDFVEEPPYCVTLTLKDSAGDGWNGAFLAIDLVTYTLEQGSEASFEVCNVKLNAGCTGIFFHAGKSGKKKKETSWSIKDSQGNVIGSGGAENGSVGDGCGWFDDCSNCQSLGLNRMYCGKGNFSGPFFGGCAIIKDGIKDCSDGRDEIGGTYTCKPFGYFPPED